MSSSSPSPGLSPRAKKVIVPKVWKRPHSTIYGKNVEFGSSLYSDKIGEINGRKFNSDLPWHVRNSGGGSSSSSGSTTQGYLSHLLNEPESTLIGSVIMAPRYRRGGGGTSNSNPFSSNYPLSASSAPVSQLVRSIKCHDYADALALTNPNRYSDRRRLHANSSSGSGSGRYNNDSSTTTRGGTKRIDFYDQYSDEFNRDIDRMTANSLLMNDPLLKQKAFDKFLDYDSELGLFVPSFNKHLSGPEDSVDSRYRFRTAASDDDGRCLIGKKTIKFNTTDANDEANCLVRDSYLIIDDSDINKMTHPPHPFVPLNTTTKQTSMLPKHHCQLADSPYGQSTDGRKLSLGSINPHSYRPALPSKTTTVQSSDGEEFEFQDRSSPFYTDRWAGKTIRHFDSDLYSNASLFKSMIL